MTITAMPDVIRCNRVSFNEDQSTVIHEDPSTVISSHSNSSIIDHANSLGRFSRDAAGDRDPPNDMIGFILALLMFSGSP